MTIHPKGWKSGARAELSKQKSSIEDRLARAEALLAEAEKLVSDFPSYEIDCNCEDCKAISSWLQSYENYKDSILHKGDLHR